MRGVRKLKNLQGVAFKSQLHSVQWGPFGPRKRKSGIMVLPHWASMFLVPGQIRLKQNELRRLHAFVGRPQHGS